MQVQATAHVFVQVTTSLVRSSRQIAPDDSGASDIANYLYENPHQVALNMKGIWLADPTISWDLVQEYIPAYAFVQVRSRTLCLAWPDARRSQKWKDVFAFSQEFMLDLRNSSDFCGYSDYMDTYLTYPPKGPLPLPEVAFYGLPNAMNVTQPCRTWDTISAEAFKYVSLRRAQGRSVVLTQVFQRQPELQLLPHLRYMARQLGRARCTRSVELHPCRGAPCSCSPCRELPEPAEPLVLQPHGRTGYHPRASHGLERVLRSRACCGPATPPLTSSYVQPVYVNRTDNSVPSSLSVLPSVIERNERTVIMQGLLVRGQPSPVAGPDASRRCRTSSSLRTARALRSSASCARLRGPDAEIC